MSSNLEPWCLLSTRSWISNAHEPNMIGYPKPAQVNGSSGIYHAFGRRGGHAILLRITTHLRVVAGGHFAVFHSCPMSSVVPRPACWVRTSFLTLRTHFIQLSFNRCL